MESYKEFGKYTFAVDDTIFAVWKVTYVKNGFEWVILVKGSEADVRAYMESEFGYMGKYTALTDDEVDCAIKLGMKIYIA